MHYTNLFEKLIVSLMLSLAFVSCSTHKIDTKAKPLTQLSAFPLEESQVTAGGTENPWWLTFNDPQLSALVEEALQNNLDVAQGQARLSQAQSILRQAHGIRYPQVNIEARSVQNWDRDQRFSYQHLGGLGLAWDPDIFGRLRYNELARLYELEAEHYYLESLRLTISSQVANSYFGAREQALQLKLLEQQIETDEELLQLVERSLQAGVVSRVDYLQQRGQLADTRTLIPLAQRSRRLFENSLDVLLGTAPDGHSRLGMNQEYPSLPELPALGIPSDLLLNRPDLRARKAELIAVDAEIGRAISEYLPRLTLSGSSLYTTGMQPAGIITDIASSLIQPLLTWGVRRAEIERNRFIYEERLSAFTQNFLIAIEEVDNALFSLTRQKEYISLLNDRKEILEETLEETQRRYTAGLTDYLPVLDTVQELRGLERDMISQERILMNFYVELLTSLGGIPL